MGRGKQLKAVGPVASCPRLGKRKEPKTSHVGSGPNPMINQVCAWAHLLIMASFQAYNMGHQRKLVVSNPDFPLGSSHELVKNRVPWPHAQGGTDPGSLTRSL